MRSIYEYLLGKNKNPKVSRPCKDMEDICKWLESYGVKNVDSFLKEPKVGELLYHCGTGGQKPYNHCVSLNGKTKYGEQSVFLRTQIDDQNVFANPDGSYSITFEEGLDIMLKMINDPNLDIEL